MSMDLRATFMDQMKLSMKAGTARAYLHIAHDSWPN